MTSAKNSVNIVYRKEVIIVLPSRVFFDNFFDDFDSPRKLDKLMKCDIYEEDNNYIIEMDVPGFKKEDINMELDDGYLKISAEKKSDSEEKRW